MGAVLQAIVGNVVADPELQRSDDGRVYTRFRVATNERYRSDNGEWERHAPVFWSVEAWDENAQLVVTAFRQGSPIIVTGPMRSQKWADRATGAPRTRQFIKLDAVGPNLADPGARRAFLSARSSQ